VSNILLEYVSRLNVTVLVNVCLCLLMSLIQYLLLLLISPTLLRLVTFYMSRRQCEMYIGHARLCVCVWLSLAAFPHYCTDPDVTWGNGKGCRLVVHYLADLQSVYGFRCYDNIAPNAKCQQVLLYSLGAWF